MLNVLSEMLLGDVSQCAEFVNPGTHRQHVNASGLVPDGCEYTVEIAEVRAIRLDRRGIAADRGDSLIQLGLMAAGNKYPRAFMSETLRNAEADAGAPAGNESDFTCKLVGHCKPIFSE